MNRDSILRPHLRFNSAPAGASSTPVLFIHEQIYFLSLLMTDQLGSFSLVTESIEGMLWKHILRSYLVPRPCAKWQKGKR